MQKILDVMGVGWKGYVAGFALILYSLVLGIDVVLQYTGSDLAPIGKDTEFNEVVEVFLMGLGLLGLRHAIAQK